MRPIVLVTRPLPGDAGRRLADAVDVLQHPDDQPIPYETMRAQLANCSGLVSVLADRVDAALLDAAPKLRVIANVAVGYDNIDLAAAQERGIVVTNTPDVLTETTADLTWALILATSRRIVEADRAVRAGAFRTWQLGAFLGGDVFGKTLGVVGFGRIGRAVARRAVGFGMRVLYVDRSDAPDGSAPSDESQGPRRVEMNTLLSEAHIVSLHTPLTPETRHLIDADALAQMRDDAVLINVARGAIVDEAALVEALQTRRIAGAGLDVYEDEPRLSPGLSELDNVVLLPHIGSASRETRARMAAMAVDGVLDVLAGRPPKHRVPT